MSLVRLAFVLLLSLSALACNADRRQECEKLLAAMSSLEAMASPSPTGRRELAPPTAEQVDWVKVGVSALALHDQPLAIYAENYLKTVTVLSSTIQLKAGASPPDGTDDVIRAKLAEARADRDDVQRYCAQ